MSEPKLIAPLLDGCAMGEPISQHRGIRCYPAMDTASQQKYIVKIISIPASQTQLDALLLTGAYPDSDAALAYFKELADDTVKEAEILQRLARLEGFCAYEGWQVEPMEDGVGYDVYLKSPYRQTLERYLSQNSMTHLAAMNLGLDLCSALSACRRSGFLYVNIKPGNIFMSNEGEYRLGDLGFIPLSSLQYASLPEKYRSCYTAPEIADAYAALNMTMDTYAVGLVLYQIFNGGQLPFEGNAPATELAPPAYADYEMAEIILKACAPDPANRWEDPSQLGQALVGYMQRNGVNDTPIIPPPAQIIEEPPAEPEPLHEEETPAEDEQALPEDEAEALSVVEELSEDETKPDEEILEELEDTDLPEDTSEMLAHADELIAHELPQAVVVPEPEDIPIILIDEEPEPEETGAVAVLTVEEEPAAEEAVEEVPAEEEPAEEAAEESAEEEKAAEEEANEAEEPAEEETVEDAAAEEDEEALLPKKKPTKLLAGLTCILLVILLGLGGWLFYTQYYLQPINGITMEATQSQLTVLLDTNINNELLTVTCTDTYANKKQATVANNVAVFTDLRPNTTYKITVEISGFHKLTGVTSTTHSTSSQTMITSFTAVTGSEDGSVILDLSVEGPQTSAWRVSYSAEGETEKSVNFTGRLVTITGLTVGKEYTFRLEPASQLYVGGTTTIKHTASKIIYAEKLTVLGFKGGKLTAAWQAPEGVTVNCWNVRCYNDAGYDMTVTVTEPTAVFEGLNSEQAYTVEVKAEGMTEGSQTYVSANSVTVSDIQISADKTRLNITWTGDAVPEEGWLVFYTIDGSQQNMVRCDGTSAALVLVPGSHYEISIEAVGCTVLGGKAEYDTSVAPLFSGYWVTAENIVFSMCRRPNKETWTRYDVKDEDYTISFTVGEKAAFVTRMRRSYDTSNDQIEILFVIRDAENVPVSFHTVTRVWTNMWYQNYGIQEVPAMPETAGSYTMEIYYNGASVTLQNFTVS